MVTAMLLIAFNIFICISVVRPVTVFASKITCNDGSVHSSPDSDYACLREGGVKSIAPYEDMEAGEKCPEYFPRAGEPIPEGKTSEWCGELTQAEIEKNRSYDKCLKSGRKWDDKSSSCMGEPIRNDCQGPNIQANLPEGDPNHCGILDYLTTAIDVLVGLAGVAIVGSIVYGGIQYSMAGSDPQKVAVSKDRIRNAIIALILLLFGFAILNYLVPGGVLQG